MKQLTFKRVNGWGGKRKGAGRPSRSGQRAHAKRPRIRLEHPLHITMRLQKIDASFRTPAAFKKFKACLTRARKFGLYVNQFALLGNHLHLIAEARGNVHLTRGMRSLGGSLGKTMRAHAGGRGAVFAGRFHLHVLKAPREYKNALAYVLLNRSRHADELPSPDRYSSAPHFRQWAKLLGDLTQTLLEGLDACPTHKEEHLSPPRSWLGRTGWRRAAR